MASKEFYESPRWRQLRYKILERDNFTCLACNRTKTDGVILHVDHIKPISLFPELAMSPGNLQTLCADCNVGKSNIYETNHRAELDRITTEQTARLKEEAKKREIELEIRILSGDDEEEKSRLLDRRCMRAWDAYARKIKVEMARLESRGDAKMHAMLSKEYLNIHRKLSKIARCEDIYAEHLNITFSSREFPPGFDHLGNPIEVLQ